MRFIETLTSNFQSVVACIVAGLTERELLLNRLTQFRYNSDGQLDQQDTGVDEACMGWRMENSVSHASLSGQERDYAGNSLTDKEV